MKVWTHKIHWPKRYNSYGEDLDFTIKDVDCYVEGVGHPCANWAVNQAWYRVCNWFQKKGAIITLGDPIEIEDENENTNKK